ncbi:MAG: hypothetical protein R6V85_04905 [Polyangia bacterium]
MKTSAVFVSVALLIGACGSSDEKKIERQSQSARAEAEKQAEAELAEANAEDKEAKTAEDDDQKEISCEVTVEIDGGPAPEARLNLAIDESESVRGRLVVADDELRVSGRLEGDGLRCWLTAESGDAGTVRRGVLLGSRTGETLFGTFALSDDGAEHSLSGRWKSGD